MTKHWQKWTMCKNTPNLKEYYLSSTEIHNLSYATVIIETYEKNKWYGQTIRCVKQYNEEEWNELKKNLKI